MDFLDMTNFKTGAAAAIVTKYLALPDAHVVGVIGSGTLSRSVLDGDDLSPGCHINVMGSYKLDM